MALGSKAQNRLRALGMTDFLAACAAAPPGCNRLEAKPSWERIPHELQRRRQNDDGTKDVGRAGVARRWRCQALVDPRIQPENTGTAPPRGG